MDGFLAKITFFGLILVIAPTAAIAEKEIVLRYSEASCGSLIPTPTEESYVKFNLGSEVESESFEDENQDQAFDSPKELTSRNPPFDIALNFDRYRVGKEYEIQILAKEPFDSFILQVRGRRDETGNVTYPGKWTKIPDIAKFIQCGKNRQKSTVVDKGLPVLLSNLTLSWRAPDENVGSMRVVASVAKGNFYQNLISREIRHESFPVPVSQCGKELGCFRQCKTEPSCSPDDTELLVTVGLDSRADPDQPEIEFKLGGRLFSNRSNFVALGLGHSYYYLNNLDIVTCSREDDRLELGHYFLENHESKPYEHRSSIRLLNSGIDDDSGLSWCSFTRPMRPETPLDLDLTDVMYHFYFEGTYDPQDPTSLIMPQAHLVQKSSFKFNITEPYVDIRYAASAGKVQGTVLLLSLILFFF